MALDRLRPRVGHTMLLSFPPDDRLFAGVVRQQLAALGSEARLVRSARRQLRRLYPRSDLSRQQHVLFRGIGREVWFAYRDGRQDGSPPHGPWWTRRGAARAVVDPSGRLTEANPAFRRLCGIVPGRRRPPLDDCIPADLWGEVVSTAASADGAGITSTATIHPPRGRRVEVEFHVSVADGPGCHALALRSFADRDEARDSHAIAAGSLRSMSRRTQAELLRGATRRTFTPGERLPESVAGEPWAVLVVSGIVRLYLGTDGVEPTLLHGTHGALLGTHWVPTDESFAVGLQSVTPATVLQLPSLRVPELLASDPGFATAVRDEGQAQLHELIGSFAARTGLSLPERLAREILVLADLQPDQVLVPVTEQQLADAIGSIRESIGRTIADFRREGWLATTRHGVIVLDRPALSRLARLDD